MRTFSQFHPMVSAVLTFRTAPGKERELEQLLKDRWMNVQGLKAELISRDGWHILEMAIEVVPGADRLVQISPDQYRERLEELKPHRAEAIKAISGRLAEGSKVWTTYILVCGTRASAWLKNYSDISFLYKEEIGPVRNGSVEGDIYQTNITYLNRILSYQGKVLINGLRYNGVPGFVYVMGRSQPDQDPCVLIEVDMDELRPAESYQTSPISVKEKTPYGKDEETAKETPAWREKYQSTVIGIKARIVELVLMGSILQETLARDVAEVKAKGSDLLEEISAIQLDINEHMKGYGQNPSAKRAREGDRETYNREKRLLTSASVHFSLVSEIENEIIRIHGRLSDLEERMNERSSLLSLTYDAHSTDDDRTTLSGSAIKRIGSELASLNEISERLTHSRVILTSTIEVLRTFLETRQREVSERMNRMINMLFLVFACFGLADALGNFVIVVLEYGYLGSDPSLGRVFEVTSIGLILTLTPLLLSAGLLYMYFQRRG